MNCVKLVCSQDQCINATFLLQSGGRHYPPQEKPRYGISKKRVFTQTIFADHQGISPRRHRKNQLPATGDIEVLLSEIYQRVETKQGACGCDPWVWRFRGNAYHQLSRDGQRCLVIQCFLNFIRREFRARGCKTPLIVIFTN